MTAPASTVTMTSECPACHTVVEWRGAVTVGGGTSWLIPDHNCTGEQAK